MKALVKKCLCLLFAVALFEHTDAQDASVNVKTDAQQIMVGDQLRVFIEAQHNAAQGRLQWASIPDSFDKLEVVEKGKIDTTKQGDLTIYRQRLLITGFDSGVFVIPSFVISVIPDNGKPHTIQTDSLPILVQTVAVDTTQPFKGIKDIMQVKSTWRDYIWYIIGAIIFLILAAYVIQYFIRNKRTPAPVIVTPPVETLQEQALRMLSELDKKQLWQTNRVKEYYVELTDIIRSYVEARFNTPALELTTDELLASAQRHRELSRHSDTLSTILYTADLAKFAKAQPTSQEHINAMELAIQFIKATKPVVTEAKPVTTETPKQS